MQILSLGMSSVLKVCIFLHVKVRSTEYFYLTSVFFINPFPVILLSAVVRMPVLFSVMNATVKELV
jgi:hypothetical protein